MNLKIKSIGRPSLFIHGFHVIQERIRYHKIRNSISNILSNFFPSRSSGKEVSGLNNLKKEGYVMLDNLLSPEEVNTIFVALKGQPCYDRWRKERGHFDLENHPKETHVANVTNVLTIPEVLKFANHPKVLTLVSQYFGCMPIIDSVHAWWSLPGVDGAENEQLFHRDNDSIKFLKLFLYLTDVDAQSGPHVYIKGSHIENKILTRDRISDEEVCASFPAESFKYFTGPKGQCFLEDTWGIHKGQVPEDKPRLLLQVRYCIVPSIFRSREQVAMGSPLVDFKFDTYVNKHIIS